MSAGLIRCHYSLEHDTAQQLSLFTRLGLSATEGDAPLSFGFHAGRLSLWQNIPQAPAPTCVDFESPEMQYRLRTSGRRQGLARAAGLHKRRGLRVVDATAGLGRDAFILAALGCEVVLLERSALIHALLEDGLHRALQSGSDSVREAAGRMSLLQADARHWLTTVSESGHRDVVYLDPMFPARRKSAGVRKDIASLQQVLGPDPDADELLKAALASGIPRVVVKRPAHYQLTQLPEADFQVKGKNSRFDVYVRSRDSMSA